MNIKKMLVASIAALSMIATSVVALAAETKPTVTGTVVEGNNAISLKISLSNIEKNCDTLFFKVKLPADLQVNISGSPYSLSTITSWGVSPYDYIISYDEKNVTSNSRVIAPVPAPANVYKSASWNGGEDAAADTYVISLSAASGKLFSAEDWLQFEFVGFSTYEALKAIDTDAFKLSDVQIRYTGEAAALTQAKGEVAVVDPTTAVEPDPTPSVSWTNVAAGTDYAGQYDGSKAAAYTVELAGDGTTYNAITWKATKDGVTKGHVTALDPDLGGEGSFKFGIAIGGVATSELSDVKAAWGDQTPSAE